jgi:hypothetical protein
MIEAQSADGKIHEFPDNTSQDVIDGAMKKYAESQGFWGQAGEFAKGVGEFQKGLVTGGLKAVEAFPGMMAGGLGAIGGLVESAGLGDPEEAKKRERFRAENPVPTLTGGGAIPVPGVGTVTSPGLPKVEGRAGKYGESIGEFIPATAAGGGGWVSKLMTVVFGGAGAQKAAEVVADPGQEPYAKIVGGIIGSFLPTFLARAVNPLPATQRNLRNIQTLQQEGVTDLTAGMRSGKKGIRYMEEHYGESPAAGQAAEERLWLPFEQLTRAVLRRIGETADRADPHVLVRARDRIGQQFDDLAARNVADIDPVSPIGSQYFRDLQTAETDYRYLFLNPPTKPIVDHILENARDPLRGQTMSGAQYTALRSQLARIRRGSKDPYLNEFIEAVRDAMDTAMEDTIALHNPIDAGAFAEVRNQYRNLLAIEQMVTGVETRGLVTPAKLKQAAVKQDRRTYAQGRGDFGQLGHAASEMMGSLPQSGTAPRQQYTSGLTNTSGLTKLATTGIAGRAIMSPFGQAWLGNQELTNLLQTLPTARRSSLISILSQLPNIEQQRQKEREKGLQQIEDALR